MGRPLIPLVDKLSAGYKVNPETDCWEWQRNTTPAGYGQLHSRDTAYVAHRLAYELWVGPIDEGNYILHKCDNRLCINPNHLFQGTQRDNCQDAVAKGRAGRYGKGDGIVHSVCGTPWRISPKGQKWCSTCAANKYAQKKAGNK